MGESFDPFNPEHVKAWHERDDAFAEAAGIKPLPPHPGDTIYSFPPRRPQIQTACEVSPMPKSSSVIANVDAQDDMMKRRAITVAVGLGLAVVLVAIGVGSWLVWKLP